MNVKGIIRLTMKQDRWDSDHDVIERDEEGNYVCAWCDLLDPGIPIKDEEQNIIQPSWYHSKVTFSGVKPEIKVKGSYKKFSVNFYNDEEEDIGLPLDEGEWRFRLVENDFVSSEMDWEKAVIASEATEFLDVQTSDTVPELEPNQIKLKFIGSDEWIGKNLEVWYITDKYKSKTTVKILGL